MKSAPQKAGAGPHSRFAAGMAGLGGKRYTALVTARWVLPLLLSLTAPALAAAAVEVQVKDGKIDLKTGGAPLSEVLSRLGAAAGFKVERQGAPPNPVVPALEIHDRTPAEAIQAVLEGLGLNFAIALDSTGAKVDTLVLMGAPAPTTSAARAPIVSRARRPFQPVEPVPDESFDEPVEDLPDVADDTPDASTQDQPPGEAPPPAEETPAPRTPGQPPYMPPQPQPAPSPQQ